MNNKIAHGNRTGQDEVTERSTDVGKHTQSITNNTANTTKLARLLTDPDVQRWHDNLARGSPHTAEVRVRKLGLFCERHRMTPKQLINISQNDVKTISDLLEDHVSILESENKSPGTIDDHLKAVKSWLRHFDIEVRRKIKIRNNGYTTTLQDEIVPNAEEMAAIYASAGLRSSVVVSLMAKAGLRPGVIGNHDGTDGLQIRDMPDIQIRGDKVIVVRTPCMVVVRRELSKARHQYTTFLTRTATQQLVAYLGERLIQGETLDMNSPVVAPYHRYETRQGQNSTKSFLPTQRVSTIVRNVFRPRFGWRPYVLRRYFATQLLTGESKTRMSSDFREYIMGHKGTMYARYTTNNGSPSKELLAEIRRAYERAEEFLDQNGESEKLLEQKRQAQAAIEDATPEQLGRILEALRIQDAGKIGQVVVN